MTTSRTRARSRRFQTFFSAIFVGLLGTMLLFATHADSTTIVQLNVTSSVTNQTVGKTITVLIQLKKNDKTPVDTVDASLTFPANTIAVSSISTSDGSFNTAVSPGSNANFTKYNNTKGTITIGATAPTAITKKGTFQVATIVFKAEAVGSAAVTFTSASSAGYSHTTPATNVLTSTVGGTYTLTAAVTPIPKPDPSPTPTPAPISTPAPTPDPDPDPSVDDGTQISDDSPDTSTDSSTDSSTDPASDPGTSTDDTANDPSQASEGTTTGPTITALHISKITASGATVSWQTDEATSGVVNYGSSTTELTHTLMSNTSQTSHSVVISGQASKHKIYFEVTVTDANSADAIQDASFTTLDGSRLASVVVAGGGSLVALILIIGIGLGLRRRRPPINDSPKDVDTTLTGSVPLMANSVVVPVEPQPAAPSITEPALPLSAPAATSESIMPSAQDVPPNPVSDAPASLVTPVRPLPPVLPPQPSLRPVQPTAIAQAQSPAPATPQPQSIPASEAVMPSVSSVPPQSAAPPLPPPPAPFPAPVQPELTNLDAIPDMFDEGEKRLEREAHEHQPPSAQP